MDFKQFLATFVPKVEAKSKQLNLALWLLETTGNADVAELQASLEVEYRELFTDTKIYQMLLNWSKDKTITDPLLKQQLHVLLLAFKQNSIPKDLLLTIAEKESAVMRSFTNFRPELKGKSVSDNDIREILKKETDPAVRKEAWEASKGLGAVLAPQILELVELRNQAARSLGYNDYFQMQLDLQEVDENWLFTLLDDLEKNSEKAYQEIVHSIESMQSKRFHVDRKHLGPWAWCDPFGQEDPIGTHELDRLVDKVDIGAACTGFYDRMGLDVRTILKQSDMLERPGKNQHAFCMNIDRKSDVRTLNNVKPTIKWLETVLHELGHAVYEMGFDPDLPWLLRKPAHTLTTEAMALIAGRQAYRYATLIELVGKKEEALLQSAEASLRRRQLIFSRWVMVMTHFERELYRNPDRDLNALWWQLVERYQKITPPKAREGKDDWASKCHLALAPVYYFSYLLGELFASTIEEVLLKQSGSIAIATPEAGKFLTKKLFSPGHKIHWNALIKEMTGRTLTSEEWIKQFS